MNMDIRKFTGKGPKCEINMCRNRSIFSIGDKGYKGGMGRTNICEDCAKQLRDLLTGYDFGPQEPQAAPVTEAPFAFEFPAETESTDYVDMERDDLIALAKSRGIKVSVTMKTDTIIKELREHDAIS